MMCPEFYLIIVTQVDGKRKTFTPEKKISIAHSL